MTGSEPGISRRALLTGAGVAGVTGVGAYALGRLQGADASADSLVEAPLANVAAAGERQAGVARPAVPQQHCLLAVLDVELAAVGASLRALGEQILSLTDAARSAAPPVPDGPGDLTVMVGLGERALAASSMPGLAAAVSVPSFAGDAELAPERLGGDLLLSVNASNPAVLEAVLTSLMGSIAGARLRWSEFGFRGVGSDGVTRNPFGYWDGIIRPTTAAELDADVWISTGPLTHGTICVVRRFALDVDAFRALDPAERDAVVGRVESSGAPLSGGARDDELDLDAKTPEGELLVPPRAHARAAHPSFTGSPLMLRRSYSFRSSEGENGHLFVSFQNEVQTFTRTQLRLDESDALMGFVTPTATAAFAILPGFGSGRPLGAPLF